MKPHVTNTTESEYGPAYTVEFPNGQSGRVWAWEGMDEWRLQLDGQEQSPRRCLTVEYAFERLTIAAHLAEGFKLNPVPMSVVQAKDWEAGDLTEYTKRLRQVLRMRTGRPWSVKVGTGTAYCWVKVEAPPKRRTVRGYAPTAEDQALLEAATGESAHSQGFNIPPTRGYQAALLLHAATGDGSAIQRAEHGWD